MSRNYMFKKGDVVELFGMLDNPERNGKKVVISCRRHHYRTEHNPSGCAYYISNHPFGVGVYIYQERMRKVQPTITVTQ